MYYVISRETDIPFDKATASIVLGDVVYDIVQVPRNSGLVSVSDFIVDEFKVVIKSDPRQDVNFRLAFEDTMGVQLQELLLE